MEHRGALFQGDFHAIESNHFFPRNVPPNDQVVSINYLGSIITHQYENVFEALLY